MAAAVAGRRLGGGDGRNAGEGRGGQVLVLLASCGTVMKLRRGGCSPQQKSEREREVWRRLAPTRIELEGAMRSSCVGPVLRRAATEGRGGAPLFGFERGREEESLGQEMARD